MFRILLHLTGYLFTLATAAGLLARFVPPDTFWPPAIIALLLPVLLLVTGLYVLILVFRREWGKLLLPLAVLVVGFPLVPRLFAFNPGHTPTATSSISVLTTNMRHFVKSDGQSMEVPDALDFVTEAAPDILLLQEVYLGRKRADKTATAIREASGLSMRHQADLRTSATFGDGLEFIGEYYDDRPAINGIIVSDALTDLGTVRVINVHLQSNRITDMANDLGGDGNVRQDVTRTKSMFRSYANAAAKRAKQAETIRKLVRESPHPVIVGGDFNDVASSYTYRRSLTPRLQDAWVAAGTGLGTTFTGPLPGLRIDFLLVDTAFTVQEVERIETGFSDHLGLKAVLSKTR